MSKLRFYVTTFHKEQFEHVLSNTLISSLEVPFERTHSIASADFVVCIFMQHANRFRLDLEKLEQVKQLPVIVIDYHDNDSAGQSILGVKLMKEQDGTDFQKLGNVLSKNIRLYFKKELRTDTVTDHLPFPVYACEFLTPFDAQSDAPVVLREEYLKRPIDVLFFCRPYSSRSRLLLYSEMMKHYSRDRLVFGAGDLRSMLDDPSKRMVGLVWGTPNDWIMPATLNILYNASKIVISLDGHSMKTERHAVVCRYAAMAIQAPDRLQWQWKWNEKNSIPLPNDGDLINAPEAVRVINDALKNPYDLYERYVQGHWTARRYVADEYCKNVMGNAIEKAVKY